MAIFFILGLLLLWVFAGILYQRAGNAQDRKQLPPPGRMIALHGGKFHLHCTGAGDITVILESGISASSISWAKVQPEIARFARVCSYDRAGFGWSDRRSSRRLPSRLAEELHELLAAAQIRPPYILVGHSYGGLIVRAFAGRFAEEVCGMVLVDALHPDEWAIPTTGQKRTTFGGALLSYVGAVLALVGVVRLCLNLTARGRTKAPQAVLRSFGEDAAAVVNRVVGEVTKLPAEVLPAVRAHWSRPKSFLTQADYFLSLSQSSREIADTALPPNLPLIVLSADNPLPERQQEQERLAQLCTDAEHIVVPKCGHWVHLDRPELVIAAVRSLMQLRVAQRGR